MSKFKKGQSGNPDGRPKGALNKSTREIKEILAEMVNFEGLVKKLEELARRGNVRAAELLFAYRYGRPVQRDTVSFNASPYDSLEGREELERRAQKTLDEILANCQTSETLS